VPKSKVCHSYSNLNFGVTFFGTQCISVFMLLSCIIDFAADSADAVITPLNIDVESYKTLHEKNLLDELSSHRCADTLSVCQSYETLHGLGLRGSVS